LEPDGWPAVHCAALKRLAGTSLSFSEITDAINAEFGVDYTRSATIGRARRMGLPINVRPRFDLLRARRWVESRPRAISSRTMAPACTEAPTLRCVEVAPRHLLLADLGKGDCRYPYGGDDEAIITFCGNPRRKGSSYCTPHFHLTQAPVAEAERSGSSAPLRLVEAV
jgi:GcrA cell cycle regulator